jgi:hypothetical protein
MFSEKNPLDGNPDFSNPDTIYDMLVGFGFHESSHDPMQRVAVGGLRNVAEGFVSEDLTEKAQAIRAMKGFLPGSEKETTFETTTHSPEEIKAGLARVVSGFTGELTDHFRSTYGIPAPAEDNEQVKTASLFKPEEETVALGLIGLGLGLSKDAEKQHKVLTPDFIWSGEPVELLTETLAQEGIIEGSPEQQVAIVNSVKEKLLTQLQGAIKANEVITQHHRRELARS